MYRIEGRVDELREYTISPAPIIPTGDYLANLKLNLLRA